MRAQLTALFLLIVSVAFAQDVYDAGLQGLANAERAFAQMAKEKNTRDAFLYFLTDDAVTSAPGQGPRTGKKHLEQQPVNESWLYWYPVYSDIAASGDFGFNTGPWEFRQNRNDEKPVASGEFVSMWKKNPQGEWKVAVDIGIVHGPSANTTADWTTTTIPLKKKLPVSPVKNESLEIERQFITEFSKTGNAAYTGLLSNEVKFYRSGKEPFITKEKIQELLKLTDPKITYNVMGGEVASSGDLAFVYGTATSEIIKDGTTQTRTTSYMRFWKKEDGKNWKIVLDLISN
jgi:ketosteroid isomerase-like protein